ncbi:MAG TPA: hypothetical protein VHU87_04480 [Rhizomicrobium sp.]|jgi:hypothetical protein|nr:hypothetical protein [Rhizomicrobium sp.]
MTAGVPRILTINGGSSSIKFALFETGPSLHRVFKGEISRIGPHATFDVGGQGDAGTTSRPATFRRRGGRDDGDTTILTQENLKSPKAGENMAAALVALTNREISP